MDAIYTCERAIKHSKPTKENTLPVSDQSNFTDNNVRCHSSRHAQNKGAH